jgi:hypothetical protein
MASMKALRAFTGRYAMNVDTLARWFCLALLTPAGGRAEPPPLPPPAAQAAFQMAPAGQVEGLRARLLRQEPSPVRSLDPAIFVEISPLAATEPAIRLPDDQRDQE